MAIEKVKAYFRKVGIEERVLEFEVSSATVELAAKAIGCKPAEIAKSLSFLVDGKPVIVVASGDARVSNSKFKSEFGEKAKMIAPGEVEEYVGHAVGGVCPFAVNDGVRVFLDASLKNFEFVYPACGSSNSAIKLSLAELEELSGAERFVDVCKDVE